jgi:hypothetical protein
MTDGSTHEGHCVVTKGEPTRPHSARDLSAKFSALAEPVWGKMTTKSLHEGLMGLEKIPNFQEFMDKFAL